MHLTKIARFLGVLMILKVKRSCESEHHDGEQVYDRDKFQYALNRMIDKHDASIGINWDTIQAYLDAYYMISKGGE